VIRLQDFHVEASGRTKILRGLPGSRNAIRPAYIAVWARHIGKNANPDRGLRLSAQRSAKRRSRSGAKQKAARKIKHGCSSPKMALLVERLLWQRQRMRFRECHPFRLTRSGPYNGRTRNLKMNKRSSVSVAINAFRPRQQRAFKGRKIRLSIAAQSGQSDALLLRSTKQA